MQNAYIAANNRLFCIIFNLYCVMGKSNAFILILTTCSLLPVAELQKRIILQRIKQCDGKDNLTVFIPEMQLKQIKRGEFVVNGKVLVHEQVNDIKGYVEVNNCKDSLNYNMCYKYFNMSLNFCDLIEDVTDLLQQVKPPLKCPFEKTTYVVKDLPVTHDLIAYMPTLGQTSYWNTIIAGFEKSKMVLCMNVQFQMTITRRG